ncbi:MAG: transcription termination/antitermination protein NusA [Magnetococcales bacterium]|nr:transcription termination/antitermination protein NusA [Magnetococcales bacterium]
MTEIMQVVDQVAREKGIDRKIVIEAMESAIQTAARKKYGVHKTIQVQFDKKSSVFLLNQVREVVLDEQWESDDTQIVLDEALLINPDIKVGETIAHALPPMEYGRVAAQMAKQVIFQKVREAERERIYQEYVDRKGQLVNGLVKRVERNSVQIDLGRTTAYLPHEEQLAREHYRLGDRIRAYIKDVRDAGHGPQIMLSRTHPQMVAELFKMEVPEIYDNIIEIKAVARDPGLRSKMAVRSNDSHIDPVGACVGIRGGRVQAVVNELQGERIDIIEWSPDPAVFVCNALAPAEVSKVVVDEEDRNIKVVVNEDQLSLAIGRKGQNVKLASELTGWKIDIITEQEDVNSRTEQFGALVGQFIDILRVEEDVAGALIQEGFTSCEEVAYVPLEELANIDGFDEDLAQELRTRARNHLLQQALRSEERKVELHVDPRLSQMSSLSERLIIPLAEKGIRHMDELAALATDELAELFNGTVSEEELNAIILEARQLAGWLDGP